MDPSDRDTGGSLVRLEAVSKAYRMGEQRVLALREVDLTLMPGAFVAVMGASGSGKSTLMNVVGLLDRPTAGRYLLAGEDVAGLDRDARARRRGHFLGFVFQGFNLLPRTSAQENVELPLLYQGVPTALRRQRARAVLEQVGLAARADHPPARLSGGQQQRVAIARALVTGPRLLLADEPTGNLDSRTSLEVMQILQALNEAGLSILLVTHEPDIAQFARRIVTFRDGRIASDVAVADRKAAAAALVALDAAAPGAG